MTDTYVISLGFANDSINKSVVNNTVPFFLTNANLNINYLMYAFRKRLDVLRELRYTNIKNILCDDGQVYGNIINKGNEKYRTKLDVPIVDINFPVLNKLVMDDVLCCKHIFTDNNNKILQLMEDKNIRKILIYHIFNDDAECLNTKNNIIFLDYILNNFNNYQVMLLIKTDNTELYNSIPTNDRIQKKLWNERESYTKDKLSFPTKHKINISVLVSGDWRCNHTGFTKKPDYRCGESLKKMLGIIKKTNLDNICCEIDQINIFICTDDLHLANTYEYYDNIKSIYLIKTNLLCSPIVYETNVCIDEKKQIYITKKNNIYEIDNNVLDNMINCANTKTNKYESYYAKYRSVGQYAKMYMSYLLMKEYENNKQIKHDIIIRYRPDLLLTDFNKVEPVLKETVVAILNGQERCEMDSDYFAIGTRDVMKRYAHLIDHYGEYVFTNNLYYFDFNGIWNCEEYYRCNDPRRWGMSPEVQLVEHLMKKFSPCYNIFFKGMMSLLSASRR